MSFDLYFYKHKNNSLTEKDIAAYLSGKLPFNISDHPKQWCYENPATGTYFSIDWEEANKDTEDIELFDSFPDLINTNFVFNINYFRPRYFGVETFTVIDKFIHDLDLYVMDPQFGTDDNDPKKAGSGELLNSWLLSNDSVTKGQHKEMNLEYMPAEKSNYFWWYQYHRQELEAKITDDIYIPNLFVIKRTEDGKLYTAASWTTHIPLVLPQVDFIIVRKKYKKLFQPVEETGIVPYHIVMEQLGAYFTAYDYEVPNLKILTQENADRMETKFNKLPIEKSIKEFCTGVSTDGFVNVPPE